MRGFRPLSLLSVATLLPAAAFAQPATVDPLRADHTTPLSYRSAFEGYRSFRIDELPPWGAVNDVVRSVGGHTGSVRASDSGTEPPAAAKTPQAPEAPPPKAMPSSPVRTEEPPHGRMH